VAPASTTSTAAAGTTASSAAGATTASTAAAARATSASAAPAPTRSATARRLFSSSGRPPHERAGDLHLVGRAGERRRLVECVLRGEQPGHGRDAGEREPRL